MPSILVQKGHAAPREPGFETATGATGEQAVVTLIAKELERAFAADDRFTVRVIPGKVPTDIRSGAYAVDAFIALHCDGSTDKKRRGWGIGYPSGAVNKKLADLVGKEIARIHPSDRIRDNYTSDMSGYYAYSRVPTPGPEILIEHGFVSSPEEREWLTKNAGELAAAERRALLAYFGLPPKPADPAPSWITPEEARAAWQPGESVFLDLPGPRPKPAWFWQARLEEARRLALVRGADDE
jgi:N-acetylmuramoyl-L-alanine amidase